MFVFLFLLGDAKVDYYKLPPSFNKLSLTTSLASGWYGNGKCLTCKYSKNVPIPRNTVRIENITHTMLRTGRFTRNLYVHKLTKLIRGKYLQIHSDVFILRSFERIIVLETILYNSFRIIQHVKPINVSFMQKQATYNFSFYNIGNT